MCHLNAYQKVSTAEKTVSNQVDTMTQPEDAFPSPLWCVLSGTVNKVTVVEGMEAVHGFNNMGFPSLSGFYHFWVCTLPRMKPMPSP